MVAGAAQLCDLRYRYGRFRHWTPTSLTAAELSQTDLRLRAEWRWRIPIVDPVRLPERDLPVDPYALGAFIANGHAGTSATITTPDPHVHKRLLAAGAVQVRDTTPVCPRFTMRGLIGPIRDLGLDVLSGQKFIPEPFALASIDQRIDLLHGLMDGDGTGSSPGRSCVRASTTSRRLAGDLASLVNSLGGTGTITSADRTGEGKPVEHTITVMLPDAIEPFSTPAKIRGKTKNMTGPARTIIAIEPVQADLVSIRVRCPMDGLVVGRNFVVIGGGPATAVAHDALAA